MKRTLITAALLAAWGGASAQSVVTIFGVVDAAPTRTGRAARPT
jgi:predicted porin